MKRTFFLLASVVLLAGASGLFFFWSPEKEISITFPIVFVEKEEHATLLFGGDLFFDRTIRTKMERGEDPLSCISPVLRDPSIDLIVANLEGPITTAPSVSQGSVIGSPENFTFTFPPSTAALLATHRIGLVNLGNNHILNFGRSGLAETKQALAESGVAYFGDLRDDTMIYHSVIKGIPFAFVGYSAFDGAGSESVIAQIASEHEQNNFVVVYAHWGEEYLPPPEYVRELAHQFVDAGADLIIGSHPHVVQESEVYPLDGGGKHIYYSLGNFLFDQYWNEEVRHGLLLRATISKKGEVSLQEIPIENTREGKVCLRQ